MPLLNHFAEPLIRTRPWPSFFSAWVCQMAAHLNERALPRDMVAIPCFDDSQCFEVRVQREAEGKETKERGVIVLATPQLKEIEEQRAVLLERCIGWLKKLVGIVLIDVVESQQVNLHKHFVAKLSGNPVETEVGNHLYVTGYRMAAAETGPRLDVWEEELAIGEALPRMPLWLGKTKNVGLPLEELYQATRKSLRV